MDQKRFENIDKAVHVKSFKDVLKWMNERRKKVKDLSFIVPSEEQPDISFLQSNLSIPTITWIGHSTFLIQQNGYNIITDPVWASKLATNKRLSKPGLPISVLPRIDYVLISHSHYDHLHFSSIKKLTGQITFLVPMGLGDLFRKKGFQRVHEFNWWEQRESNGLCFTFVPAQHWTRRTLYDTNTSHWGGWIIQNEEHSIYFVGDSGYFSGFKKIGQTYKIDYCLMPIGAYEPEWFMSAQHVNPEEAVQAFIDTNASTMIPMHYGAFRLADDTPEEALDRLNKEWDYRALPRERLKVMKLGETITIGSL